MRLQSVMKGQSVKRQTMNTMRCMQMLVRVQSQIRTRRLQMMESRNIQQHQMMGKNERDIENSLNKWNFGHQVRLLLTLHISNDYYLSKKSRIST